MRVTILAHKHEDPESPLAEGPVLEIIRSVQSALQWLPAATLVGAKEATRKRTPPHSTSLRSMVTLAMSRIEPDPAAVRRDVDLLGDIGAVEQD